MIIKKCLPPLLSGACGLMLLSGCFTGIESTPRISDSEVVRKISSGPGRDVDILAGVVREAPGQWRKGKRFRVTDNKIELIFTAASAPAEQLAGKELLFESFARVPSLTEKPLYEVRLVRGDAPTDTFYYRLPPSVSENLTEAESLDIPFTVDVSLSYAADSIMRGKRYYITIPNWYDPADGMKSCAGLRHVQVEVDSVTAGTDIYPLAVNFHLTDSRLAATPEGKGQKAVYLTVGNGRAATRNFPRIFNSANPRKNYPQITDEVWNLIIHSDIRKGMTRDEAGLALGPPTSVERTPVRNGWIERWTYSDGIYIIFDNEGYISNFRK